MRCAIGGRGGKVTPPSVALSSPHAGAATVRLLGSLFSRNRGARSDRPAIVDPGVARAPFGQVKRHAHQHAEDGHERREQLEEEHVRD